MSLARWQLGTAAILGLFVAGCGAPVSEPASPTASPERPTTAGSAVPGPSPAPAGSPILEPSSTRPGRGLAFDFEVGEIKPARDYLAEPRFAAADLERGELLSLACQACHTLRRNQRHNVGPNLYGIFGRRAAAASDFPYSDALRSLELVWTPEALEAWLVAPADFVIGNNMTFAGYASATDRRDLIAFLLRVTSLPAEPESVE